MLQDSLQRKKSRLVQIMNEVDDLNDDQKKFVLYWLKAKRNAGTAAGLTIKPNKITLSDIYKERNALRKQNA